MADRAWWRASSILLGLVWASSARAAPLSVEEAVAGIAGTHPEVLAARAEAAASRAAAKSARGHLLPAIHLSDRQLFTFTKPSHSGFVAPLAGSLNLPVGVGAQAPQDFSVNLLQVGAVQPLLGLLKGAHAWRALGHQAAAAQLGARRQQELVEAQVKSGYLQLFEARALAAAAAEAQADLQEQASIAQRKVEAGSLTLADVLRVRVAAATAAQQVIAADAQAATLQAALVELLGLGDGRPPVEFAAPTGLLEDAAVPVLEVSREAALAQRLDLRQGAALAQAAHRQARAQSWSLLPELSVQAGYVFASLVPIRSSLPGGPAQVNSGIVGLSLDWAVWEWGTSWYARAEAQARARAARLRLNNARHQVAAEVAARHHGLTAARAAIAVSALQVEAASEAYRVVRELVAAASATTTDLLDAQSALTGARTRHVQNRYEAAVARVALELAASGEAAAPRRPPPPPPPPPSGAGNAAGPT